jgi:hypothetical protein
MYEDKRFENESTICVNIDFKKAVVNKRTLTLTVTGKTGCSNTKVYLQPVIYVRKPEYWRIIVVGCRDNICLPAVSSYEVSINLEGIIGTKGIAVVGATTMKKIDIP